MSVATLAHAHLLLNHLPAFGFLLGVALLAASIGGRSELIRAGFATLFLVALMSLPTYMTGYAARTVIQHRTDYSEALIERHQAAALLALMSLQLTGLLAWVGLWRARRRPHPSRVDAVVVLLFSLVAFGLTAAAANLGGQIAHPELRTGDFTAGPALSWFARSSIAGFVKAYRWTWPVCEVLHFIGLSLLFGVVLLINLRVLGAGVLTRASFADLHRLLPWGVAGFAVNAVSGMVFFTVAPQTYVGNLAFHWKMAAMLLAGAAVLYHTMFEEPWALEAGADAPLRAKLIAATQMGLWLGVIYFGRMIPYLTGGTSAGAL